MLLSRSSCILALLLSSNLFATVTYSGASGSLAASASFSYSANNLTVVLTNTSAADVLVPRNVLTAVVFNVAGSPTLAGSSAVLTSGSTVLFAPSGCVSGSATPCNPSGPDMGAEWAFRGDITGFAQKYGISSSGLT